MKRILPLVVLVLALTLVSCQADPVYRGVSDNPQITVDLLFVYEGCKMYRFRDGKNGDGQVVYYANCQTNAQTSWQHSCGKGCIKHENVTTGE